MKDNCQTGHVYLVGSGPGDPGLLTMRAHALISSAKVVVHDRLVSERIMALVPASAQLINVGKAPDHHPFPQENINALLVSLAGRHESVLRLKGGDPYMFGRGSEEVATLRAAGIGYTVVPGVSAAQGISASTGVPLTHRGMSTGVRFVTGHCRAGHDLDLDWSGLADPGTTLVVYMGRGHAQEIAEKLIAHGLSAEMPAMLVMDGTRPTEKRVYTTLAELGAEAARLCSGAPVLMVVGHVVDLADDLVDLSAEPLMDRIDHG